MPARRSSELTVDELREILRLPNHLIAIITPDGTFHKVNEEANPVLGWEPEEVIGKKVKDFVHPEDWEETFAHMASVFVGSRAIVEDLRNRIRRKDGTWRWISWSGKAHGGYIYAHGSDVTEKVEFEEALTVQSLVLESISEGVTICNDKGVIVFANSAAERLYGYEVEELLGNNIGSLSTLTTDERTTKIAEILAAISRDKIWIGELTNRKKTGEDILLACRVTTLDLHGERHYVCVQRDITQRKRLSREREELETRFRTFFEQSALPMVLFDAAGNPLDVNTAWEDLYQVTRKDLVGYNILTDGSTVQMGLMPYLQRALAGESVMVPPFFNDPARHPNGGRPGRARWLEAWFSPIKNADGSVRELAVILKDVTEQIETRRELEELETKYRVASESLSLAVKVGKIGVWEWLPKDDRVIWDEIMEEIYGYEKGTFSQKTSDYSSHLHPDDVARCWEIITEGMRTARPYTMDHRIFRKADGAVRWVQGAGMPFYNSDGEVIRILGTAIDITERKEQEEDQKFLSEISGILSASFDYIGNIQKVANLVVSRYFDNMTVYQIKGDTSDPIAAANSDPEKEAILRELLLRHHEAEASNNLLIRMIREEKEVFYPELDKIIAQSGLPEYHLTRIAKLGIKSVLILNFEGREGFAGYVDFHVRPGKVIDERMKRMARDIAYRISLALENSVLYQQSQEAIRARDEFLSIASHELKTPLQSLTLQNEMRKRMLVKGLSHALEKNELQRALDMDRRQLQRINRLIEDMLDISRIRNAKLSILKEPFNLSALMKDIHERMLPQLAGVGCEFRLDVGGDIMVNADSYRIEQVLVNLFINAMKYGAGKPVMVTLSKKENMAVVEVRDSGTGIREEDLERIFQRFERAVKSHDVTGLGLGLYIAREIMQLHHGKIYARSKLGEGSTFILELPL